MNTSDHRFPKSIILFAVYSKLKFGLSYREVECTPSAKSERNRDGCYLIFLGRPFGVRLTFFPEILSSFEIKELLPAGRFALVLSFTIDKISSLTFSFK